MATEKRPTLTLSKKKRDPNAPKVSITRNPNVSIGVVKRSTTETTSRSSQVDESARMSTNDGNRYETRPSRSPYGYHAKRHSNGQQHNNGQHNSHGNTGYNKKPFSKKPRPARPAGVHGRMELTIKLNELPNNVQTVKNQWRQFDVKADDQIIRLRIRPKAWNKMAQANEQWESWVAAITGKMGNPIKDGFELIQPAVQVYEKKPKQHSDDSEEAA
ncbi:hypothetical protein [Candidatus Albibeggiatoa sp. nov. NOAA]|uniref:hypothetical protein n=1 Tax=Candidatus Albibeggiatoa sp. nov. NOAA TaxID=3162724 RepID=UPI003302FCA2|nr:hypothetical protein [Thiotrichaceae bacterium]